MHVFKTFLRGLSSTEKRNIIFYIIGLMCYKFSIDSLMQSFQNAIKSRSKDTQENMVWAIVLSCNIIMQCFGSLMVSPLVYRYSPQRVLPYAVISFALVVLFFPLLLHLWLKPSNLDSQNVTYLLAGLYALAGFSQGVVELVRRTIPERIVGTCTDRLKSFDSMVHLCYEVAGVTGAFSCYYIIKSVTIQDFGFFLFPCFAIPAAFFWSNVRVHAIKESFVTSPPSLSEEPPHASNNINNNNNNIVHTKVQRSILRELKSVFQSFALSVRNGFFLVLSNRSLIWLIPAYSVPLLLHRYFEGVLLKHYAEDHFGDVSVRLQFVAGSNFGEFCGALLVILFSGVKSPLPWLRLDALTLFLTWFLTLGSGGVTDPTRAPGAATRAAVFALCSTISLGFASGDVTLNAYIQARLAGVSGGESRTSPLGSVMSFLYVSYILLFAVFSIPINAMAKSIGASQIIFWTCVAYSAFGVFVFLATFIPKGSLGVNPYLCAKKEGPIKFPKSLGGGKRSGGSVEATAEAGALAHTSDATVTINANDSSADAATTTAPAAAAAADSVHENVHARDVNPEEAARIEKELDLLENLERH